MLTSADDSSSHVLSVKVLAMLLAACVGLSYVMVPRRGELIERLFKDRQFERVAKVLQDEVHGMQASELRGLRAMGGDEIESISRILYLTPREQLRTVFQSSRPPAYNAYIHHIVLAAVRFVDVVPPQEALEMIDPKISRVPTGMRADIYRLIAHNFHALGKPGLAANALRLAIDTSPDWSLALEMAQSYRWSGQPGMAASQLRIWLVSHESSLKPDELVEARKLNYSLAMEAGDPSGAYDACVTELRTVPADQLAPDDLMMRTLDAALQSSRTKDFIPWIRRQVNAMPQAGRTVKALRAENAAHPEALKAYREWLVRYSQWSDWNAAFDDAFDAHLRLAAMGDLMSLDRCVALYDYLGRTEECLDLLLVLGDIKERPQLPLLCARQLAELDQDAEAKVRFEAWLKIHPEDRDAHFDYCCLIDDLGDEDASMKAFEEMLKHHPKDVPAMKKLAEALIRAADYKGALDLYAKLPDSSHDHDTLENYAMIAESTDDHEAEFAALTLTARLSKEPSVELYLDIAEAGSYLDDPQRGIDALNTGLERLPESAQLRIALANSYLHTDRPAEALAALMHPRLKNNFEALQVLLNIADDATDPAKILAFIGDDVEKRFRLSDHNRLRLAVLNQAAGRTKDADRLLASVKEASATYHMLAETRFALGDFANAARLMDSHLKTHPSASSAEWLFMGDIYEHMGRFDEAKKAYDFSVALLTADLPGTASN